MNLYQLFSLVNSNDTKHFRGWMLNELTGKDSLGGKWFVVLWQAWIDGTYPSEIGPRNGKDQQAENRKESSTRPGMEVFLTSLRETYVPHLKEGHEKNLRQDFVQLTRLYLALQKTRDRELFWEKESLFEMNKLPKPKLFKFYRSAFLKKVKTFPFRDALFYDVLRHFLDIEIEFKILHPKTKLNESNLDCTNEVIKELAHVTSIAEGSLYQLATGQLIEPQKWAFAYLGDIVKRHHPEALGIGAIGVPSAAFLLSFLYRWKWEYSEETRTLDELNHGISLIRSSIPYLQKDLATNIIYIFHNISTGFCREKLDSGEYDRFELLRVRLEPYRIAIEEKLLSNQLMDFFNLIKLNAIQIDWFIQNSGERNFLSFNEIEEAKPFLLNLEKILTDYIAVMPEELQEPIDLQAKIILNFYLGNADNFPDLEIAFMRNTPIVDVILDTFCEWYILKEKLKRLSEVINVDTDEAQMLLEKLLDRLKALRDRTARNQKKSPHTRDHLIELSNSARFVHSFLLAKKPATKINWLEKLNKEGKVLDKYWLHVHLKKFC